MARVSLWLVGNCDTPEFQHVVRRLSPTVACDVFDSLPQLLGALRQASSLPHLVIVVQSRPAEFRESDLWAIYEAAPLTRVCLIVGPWCEGEPRSGHPPTAVLRYYWHQWEPRLSDDIQRLEQGRCPLWGMPLTAGDDERLLETIAETPFHRNGLVVVYTQHAALFDCLADACETMGLSSLWLRHEETCRTRGVAAIVWDTACLSDQEQRRMRQVRERLSAPLLALLSYPRRHTEKLAQSAGANAVLAKPFLMPDFWWHLKRLLETPLSSSAPSTATAMATSSAAAR